MSELTEAIKRGDAEEVGRILDRDPASIDEVSGGVSAMMLALYHGKNDIARLFVARGRRLTFPEACALGERARVEAMLREEPSLLDRKSPDGYPPVGLAIFFHHPEIARFLIEQGADVSAHADNPNCVAPVHAAAAACDHETMRMLLARGANPNARQQMDYTALHGAASRGDVEMAKLLIEAGGDSKARGTDGKTLADVAIEHGHPAFAEWLTSAAGSNP